MNNRISSLDGQAATPLDTLIWAERNLSQLARHSAARIDGEEYDTVHLAAVFGLLKARIEIRAARREVELLGRVGA